MKILILFFASLLTHALFLHKETKAQRIVITYTEDGEFEIPTGVEVVEVLIVAGGGGGGSSTSFGNAGAGGGGAGGVVYRASYDVSGYSSPVSVIVGQGGLPGASGNNPGSSGANSSFGNLIAIGGGGGAGGNMQGLSGGSGGGSRGSAGGVALQPASAHSGYGYRGGNSGGSPAGAAATGGGGAGSPGENLAGSAGEKGGDGGDGLPFEITGSLTYYAGGGGGGAAQNNSPVGQGGQGGGGSGGNNSVDPEPGEDGTGGGGGGGNNNKTGAKGGSGIVIIAYDGCAAPVITFEGPPFFAPGGSIELSAVSNYDITSYQWTFNGEAIGGATSPVYNATESGEYTVIVNYEYTVGGDTFNCEDIESAPVNLIQTSLPVTDGLVLHLDAWDIQGITNGANLAQWEDLSGEGNHALQSTPANQPTYQEDVLNGLPVVRFDGNRIMEVASSPSLNFAGPGLTIFTVFNPLSLQSGERPIIRKNDQYQLGLLPNEGGIRNRINTTGETGWTTDNDESFDWEADSTYIFGFTWDGTTLHHFVDATQMGDGAEVTGSIIANANPLLIGGEAGGNRVHADIGEVLVFNRTLTNNERSHIQNFLYDKWIGERRTWYADGGGNWDDHLSWSLIDDGSENPNNEIPGPMDRVVIDDATITISRDNISVGSMEVRSSGVLDLGSTLGHNFRIISGQGTIRLSSDNFPAGYAEDFKGSNGGTVEFYGNGFELETPHAFNNMVVNLNANNEALTMLADYSLNGNLTITRGRFRINGNSNDDHTDVLHLTVRGDLSVHTNGSIGVGEANTAEGFQIQNNGTLPGLGHYHSIFHQVRLYGDFTNNGTVRFTNLSAPNFQEFAGNGAAVVTFAGTRNQEVELYGTTDFYNLIVDKGSGQTRIVDIYAQDADYFALFGPNNMGNRTGGNFSEENPEIRKALWIRNGTLKLRGSMLIPSLTEGNERGGRGDWTIPANGKLWIEGGDVVIYTTIRTDAQRPDGTGWHKSASGHTALTVFGSFRIDNGFFGTRHSAGFIYRSEEAATVKINGGVIDAVSFRSSGDGGGGRTYYYQTGGEVRVRGSETYLGEYNGETSGAWPLFGIIFPEGVFSMSGGEILMIGRSRDNNSNAYGNNAFYVASEDYNVTGGTIKLMPRGGWNYYLHSTANLWNLEMERRTTSGNVNVWLSSELVVGNDLTIGDHCTFHPRIANGETNHNVYIGGDLVLGQTPGSNANYNSVDGTNGNTTTFFGSENSTVHIANNTGIFLFEFYDLVIDKNSHDLEVNIISPGRDAVDMKDGGPFSISPFRVRSSLTVKRGILDYGDFALIGVNENFTVENRSSIGKLGDKTGFLLIDQSDQIIAPLGTEPIFGNLVINNDGVVYLTGNADITIGNLGMRQGVLDIGSQGITVEENIINIDDASNPNPDFDQFKFIRTAGKHSDRGITRRISANDTYLFPLGIQTHTEDGNRYTPAEPQISDLPASAEGYLQINNVDRQLATLNPDADNALQYYWRVRHSGFDNENLPIVKHTFVFHDLPKDYGSDMDSYREGKVVNLERKTNLGSFSVENTSNTITLIFENENTDGDPTGLSPIETGEFTAGENPAFTGEVQVYFSRLRGTSDSQRLWGDAGSWTTLTQLRVVHGTDVLHRPELWHLSSNPASIYGTPGEGQIAIIGWVPHGDPDNDKRGDPHNIKQSGGEVQCAEIIFNPMLTPDGDPAPRQYWDSYFFRPTLTLTGGATINVPIISGEGTIRNRQHDPDFSSVDLGDFAAADSSYVLYEVVDGADLTHIPEVLPNLMIAPEDWDAGSRTATIPKDILVNQNLEIVGTARLRLNQGTEGDITALGDLRFLRAYRWDPEEVLEGAQLIFQNTGTPRTLTVHGNIYNEGSTALYVEDPDASAIEHTLNLYGNYVQHSESDIGGAGYPVLRLATAGNEDRIILNLLGDQSIAFTGTNNTSPINIYRLYVNKGNSINTQANIQLPLIFSGPTHGITAEKPLQLVNGKLILNHEENDINLTTGGDPFSIPSTSGLVVAQGEVHATNSNVSLGGLLRLENNGKAHFEETLLYSSSGQAALQLAGEATLEVGKQIRSTTGNEAGVLRYDQSGGSVVIGTNHPDENQRAVFEVMNPGSEFFMTGGTLTIAAAQPNPDRAALFLRPNFSNVSDQAVIQIGHASSSGETIEIDVSEDIILPSLSVTQGSSITAKLKDNDLTLRGNLEIGSGNAFDGSLRHLTVGRNIINQGEPTLQTDSLILAGNVQTLQGAFELKHLVVNSNTSLTLEGADTHISINGNFYLNTGTLHDAENTVTVLGDLHNYAIHSSTGDGRIVFSGDQAQEIHGNGVFGNLEINKSDNEVRLRGPMELDADLYLTNGLLNIDRYRFTLGLDSEIIGNGNFGVNRMIVSRGVVEDRGIAKKIGTGSGWFTLPIGVPDKYTPVVVDYETNSSSGLFAVAPINIPHMTIDQTGDEEVLQFYWQVESENLEDFFGDLNFYYDPGDIKGDVTEYIGAWLLGTEWNFGYVEYENGENEDHENRMVYVHSGECNISGSYTAGHPDDIPEVVPVYISAGSGDWETATNWILKDSYPVQNAPSGGPSGVFVEIGPEHTITINEDRTRAHDITVDGTLNLGKTRAHRFNFFRGSGVLTLEDRYIPSGNLKEFFSTPGSTIVYGGDTDYTISGRYSDFQNIVFKGVGERRLREPSESAQFRVFGNMWIQEQAILEVEDLLELRGDLSIDPNAGYHVPGWTYFAGSNHQEVSGNFEGAKAIKNVRINKSGGSLTIHNRIEIESSLYLERGVIDLGEDSHITLKNTGGLHSSSILDRSWINGPLTRNLGYNSDASGNTNLFPVGNDSMRRFVRLAYPEHDSGTRPWTVHYKTENVSLAGMNPGAFDEGNLTHIHHPEYWQITPPEGVAGARARISLGYGIETGIDDDDLPSFEKDIAIVQWNDGQWKHAGNPDLDYEVNVKDKKVTTNQKVIFSAAKSEGNFFTFGSKSGSTPLPIELLSFTAQLSGDKVELQWVTATETLNDFFTIERSSDGQNFEVVAVIASQAENGYSTQPLHYMALDTQPLEGMNYYRLKQTDFDGSYEYSELIGVMYKKTADVVFNLFPNPNKGNAFHIALNGLRAYESLEISITSLQGRRVYHTHISANEAGSLHSYIVPSGRIPTGVYLVTVTGNSGRFVVRMVVS